MLEPRLYRGALLAALAAAVVLMFSVVSRPEPLRSEVAADAFDGARAAALDRQLLELAPDRRPGGRGDTLAADFVAKRFGAVRGGQVSVQRFEGSFDGEEVRMRNVSLILPGQSDRRIVIVAPRDCASGPCAVSSGAATAALLELASDFSGTRHVKTLVLVSTDGSTAGAAGARELAEALAAEPADAVIVISQPGAASPARPFVVPWSAGPQSTSIQLLESAVTAVSSEAESEPITLRTFSTLFRLAIPSGLGEQAVFIEQGSDAIALSSAGDLPLDPSGDGLDSLSADTLGNFGRATLSLVLALDAATSPLEHGPDAYLPLAGKLIPGWALALLAATLLLPVGVVSIDGLARASRRQEPVLGSLAWVLGRSIPFLGALVLAYVLALIGLIPRPDFPFDPQRHDLDLGAVLALLALCAAFALALAATRGLSMPSDADEALAPAVGLVVFAATAGVWLANPYLALLLVPTAHLWLAASLRELRSLVWLPLLAAGLGLVLPLVAAGYLGSALGAGWGVPWDLVLMFTGRHFGPLAAIPLCAVGGCLVAVVELAVRPRAPRAGGQPIGTPRLGLRPGPGALGGPPSAPLSRLDTSSITKF